MNNYRHMLLAWALLGSLVAAFAMGVWLPLREQTLDGQRDIAAVEGRIAKFTVLKSRQAELVQEVSKLKQDRGGDNAQRFIVAKSPTLGAAELQRRIKDVVDEFGAKQTSSQPLTGTETDDFHRLELSVNLSGSMAAILEILYELEQEQPRIFITQALIQASRATRRTRRSSSSRNARNVNSDDALNLSVRLKVAAYMQKRGKPDANLAVR